MVNTMDDKSSVRTRGRPRGSGIDDAGDIAAARALLDANPRLKPTTAIRQLGIINPSIVRRLRNKLSAMALTTTPRGIVPAASPATKRAAKPLATPAPQVVKAAATPAPAASDETPRQAQERALLAAYLEALRREAVVAPSAAPAVSSGQPTQPDVSPSADKAARAQTSPGTANGATGKQDVPDHKSGDQKPGDRKLQGNPQDYNSGPAPHMPFGGLFPPMSGNPFAGALPGMPPMPGFAGMPSMPGFAGLGLPGMNLPGAGPGMSFPGFPSFMQPLQQKAAPPAPGTDAFRQLEAFKLAIEAMTSIAKFQLHLVQNANAYSPLSLMLQGQAFMGQMLMASLTGQMDAMGRKK